MADVIIFHSHVPKDDAPWRWQVAPKQPPSPVPIMRWNFKTVEDAETDAKQHGHSVREVRE